MKISIITISYNNELDIESTILSVINQTYKDIEYIIIDGGSTDNTISIIDKFKNKINKVISEPDNGIYDAINKGIEIATGEIVGLIHAGDRLFSNDVVADIASFFKNNPTIDISYGHDIIVKKDDYPLRVNKSPEYSKKLIERGWMPAHQSIYIKRDAFKKHGLYSLDLGGSGDYEFFLRYFYFTNLKIKRLDKFILKFSFGGRSTSSLKRTLRAQKVHAKCWKLNGKNPPFLLIPLKLLRKIPQFIRAYKLRLKL
jgi:glycosyltransferase involved in cell wall biosynthesis